jgi:anti-anti-sigma factor
MKVTRSERDGVAVLRLVGEFDSFETEEVRRMFDSCLRVGRRHVVFDVGDMTFANSTTIAYFITAQKRALEAGGGLILARPGDFLKKTLKTLGLDRVLTIRGTVDEAIQALRDLPPPPPEAAPPPP